MAKSPIYTFKTHMQWRDGVQVRAVEYMHRPGLLYMEVVDARSTERFDFGCLPYKRGDQASRNATVKRALDGAHREWLQVMEIRNNPEAAEEARQRLERRRRAVEWQDDQDYLRGGKSIHDDPDH